MSQPAPKKRSGALGVVVDYGPIAVFFLAYRWYAPAAHDKGLGEVFAVIRSTIAFMIAAVIALSVSKWRLGRISPMLWLSTALIVGFGSLTIYFQDGVWIQRKPTVAYILFGSALLVGVSRGKALLKFFLEAAFDGLSDEGWLKLSRNWGWFFFFLAALNEGVRHFYNGDNGNIDKWIAAKLWVFMPLSFLFTFVQLPMLMRHGLSDAGKSEVETAPPHE